MATTKYTYTDAVTNERSVVPILDLVSPKDVPFLRLIGGGTDEIMREILGKTLGL